MLWSMRRHSGVFIAAYLVEASIGRNDGAVLVSDRRVLLRVYAVSLPLAATLTSSAQNIVVMCCWAGIATLTSELAPAPCPSAGSANVSKRSPAFSVLCGRTFRELAACAASARILWGHVLRRDRRRAPAKRHARRKARE